MAPALLFTLAVEEGWTLQPGSGRGRLGRKSAERHRTPNPCSGEELTVSSQLFGHGPSTVLHWKEEGTSVNCAHMHGNKCTLGRLCLYVVSSVRYASICIQCVCVTGRLTSGVYMEYLNTFYVWYTCSMYALCAGVFL